MFIPLILAIGDIQMAKHVHKFKKVKLGRGKDYVVYACTLPDCTTYYPSELIVGKRSICWRCGEPFIITANLKNLTKLHCRNCTSEKGGREATPRGKVTEISEEMFEGLIPRLPKV